jgi:lysophospholipase L1-like esterase
MRPFAHTSLAALTLALLLGVPATGRAEPLPAANLTPNTAPLKILALGDSITKGVRSGVAETETFSAKLTAQNRGWTVVNRGIGGEMAKQGRARLVREFDAVRPDLVLLMYGTNDSYVDAGKTEPRVTRADFERHLTDLVVSIRRFGAEPVLMTEPRYAAVSPKNGRGEHCNILLSEYVAITRTVAATQGCTLIDHFAGWEAAESAGRDLNDWTTDGYHPNPAGHEELAVRIAETLAERVASRSSLPFAAWERSAGDLHAVSITGVESQALSVLAQPGALYFVYREGKPPAELKLPRLARVVERAWWWPLTDQTPPVPGVTLKEHEVATPFLPPVDRLLKFTQSPTDWTIHTAPAADAGPCVVVFDLATDLNGPNATTLPLPSELERPIQADVDGEIVLDARLGRPTGEKLQFEPLPHKLTVGYWVNPADFVEWSFQVAHAGDYELHLLQGCGTGQGGSDIAIDVASQSLPYTVVETGHFQNFRWHPVGVVNGLSVGPQTLKIRCVHKAKAAVMDVRQVRLVPKATAAASTPATPDAAPRAAADRFVPPLTLEPPAPGKRSLLRAPGYDQTEAYHTLTLPTNWVAGQRYPVYVEWTGNGHYLDPNGERTTGRVEDGRLAHGLAGNDGVLVIALPYLNAAGTANVDTWWGTAPEHRPESTIAYATAALDDALARFGGDPERVVLMGFSRGAIAVNALGLATDEFARRWRAMLAFSHYDGVRPWPVAASDRASASLRLARLNNRPQLVLSESPAQLAETEAYLKAAAPNAQHLYFMTLQHPAHSDSWALRPSPARTRILKNLEP